MHFFPTCIKHLTSTAYFCHWQLWHYILLNGTHSFYLMQVTAASLTEHHQSMKEAGVSSVITYSVMSFSKIMFCIKIKTKQNKM